MTIRDLFRGYLLNGVKVTLLHEYNKIATLHVRFDDIADDDFKAFDALADSYIVAWYARSDGEFIIYI